MMTLLPVVCLGFFLGMRHATDADHIIAVATIVSRQRAVRKAALVGAAWGVGHTLTVMIVGGAILLFGVVIPPRLGMSMEFSVALMLILLGAGNLKSFNRWLTPFFNHGFERDESHFHSHRHEGGDFLRSQRQPYESGHPAAGTPQARLDSHFGNLWIYQAVRPVVVGVVHGLAGSAAVVLLVLPIIHDPISAVAYLALFGIGTIAGMMLITAAIGWPLSYSASRSTELHRRLCLASGLLSIGFGVFMIYQIGFVQGLFTK